MAAAPTPERERERKGPWANRVLSTDIEKTPEYDAFIEELSEYHQKRRLVVLERKGFAAVADARATELCRTTLTVEPELGRKLLDLRKLYEKVTTLGGYDKVTEEKGRARHRLSEGGSCLKLTTAREHRSLERSCLAVQACR